MKTIKEQIFGIIVCPFCHGNLDSSEDGFECPNCKKSYPFREGIPDFSDFVFEKTVDSQFHLDSYYDRTIVAKLHNIGKKFINSEYMHKKHVAEFMRGIEPGSIIIELGSGKWRLREDVINIDLFPFPNVDVLADINKMPFKDASVDFVVIDSVLDHVPEPHVVVNEIYRVLREGGKVICIVPWICSYHACPKHYFNFSMDALEYLFRDFSECKVEMDIGPTSAITNIIADYFALALSGDSKSLFSFFKGLTLLPIFLLKYLDRFWSLSPNAKRIAASLCAVAKK